MGENVHLLNFWEKIFINKVKCINKKAPNLVGRGP